MKLEFAEPQCNQLPGRAGAQTAAPACRIQQVPEFAFFRSEEDRNSAQSDEPAGIGVHHRSNYGTPGG